MRIARPLAPLLLSLALVCACGAAPAQAARPLQRATAGRPVIVYASVQGAGVFEDTDLTAAWQGLGSLPSDALALATADPDHWRIVYAGLRTGVYASSDSGTTWKPTTLRGHSVYALSVDAHDPNTILAGTDHGVFRSTDGGATWTAGGGITRTVTALAPVAGSSSVYAGGSGRVWLSTDGGVHWSPFGRGLPGRAAINAVAVSMTDPTTVFAATSQGLWEEVGGVWKALRRGGSGHPFTGVSTDPARVFAVARGDTSLYVSTDNGATWSRRAVTGLQNGATTLAQDPQQPDTLLVGGADGSVRFSTDGGTSWATSSQTVAGTVGSPVLALALVRRRALPVDGVIDPHTAGVQWLPVNGGHTIRGAFLTYYQAHANLLGAPLSEDFYDPDRNGAHAQYFQTMELLADGNHVTPAPLGLEAAPVAYTTAQQSYTVDAHFQSFVDANGGADFFGAPVSPAFKQSTNDGTGRYYLVQYFRNARLEYHPEAASAGKTVQLGLLGQEALQAKGWM